MKWCAYYTRPGQAVKWGAGTGIGGTPIPRSPIPVPRTGPATMAAVTATSPPRDADAFVAAAYAELRRLAAAYLRRERPGQTLQATALVHEAYLRLAQTDGAWNDKRHF